MLVAFFNTQKLPLRNTLIHGKKLIINAYEGIMSIRKRVIIEERKYEGCIIYSKFNGFL